MAHDHSNKVTNGFILESHNFQTRAERSNEKFNLFTKTQEQVWCDVVFCLTNYIRGRYVMHEVVEIFEPIKTVEGIETGTVQYILNLTVLDPYPSK